MTGALLAAFLFTGWPREIVALAGAGVLLCSRKMHSRQMLGLVDWQLLVLFAGLFVVNHALEGTGAMEQAIATLGANGVDTRDPRWLFALIVVLSNVVSNVPAVMLLLPLAEHPRRLGAGAGVDARRQPADRRQHRQHHRGRAAARHGIVIGWREHARVGVR